LPSSTRSPAYRAIYDAVRRIPRGHVATYGQVATLAGLPGRARQVGYALHALRDPNDKDVPWHRVINARGEIVVPGGTNARAIQRKRLEHEGIAFFSETRIKLRDYRWQPE
jgi:methylated-DNA-protein-cysteine methyltransferase-like protein